MVAFLNVVSFAARKNLARDTGKGGEEQGASETNKDDKSRKGESENEGSAAGV